MAAAWDDYQRNYAELVKTAHEKQEKQLLAAFDQAIAGLRATNEKTLEIALAGKQKEAAEAFVKSSMPAMEVVNEAAEKLVACRRRHEAEQAAAAAAFASRIQWVLVFSSAGAFALAIAISVLITCGITGPIRKSLDFARTVAQGDLAKKLDISQRDEIGQLAGASTELPTTSAKSCVPSARTPLPSLGPPANSRPPPPSWPAAPGRPLPSRLPRPPRPKRCPLT